MVDINFSLTFLCFVVALAGIKTTLCANDHPLIKANQCIDKENNTLPRCGVCGENIKVTITALNKLVPPIFEHTVTLSKQPQRELIYFLEQAAEAKAEFKFETTYYRTLGYFIESINGLRSNATAKVFWHIVSVEGVGSLDCGASSFIPNDKEYILFNFTTWKEAGFEK